jgi:hypothetical protein
MKIFFDDRTHIFRDGVETTMLGIHHGDRIYVDTLLDGSRILAKNIRVETHGQAADARGQILEYNAKEGRLQLRDDLTSRPVSFRVTADTVVRSRERAGTLSGLLPRSLVQVHFSPDATGHGVAREVEVYAAPGSMFTFAGKVTYLDMSRGKLALQNRTDDKNYEVEFNPLAGVYNTLNTGSDVTVSAIFDGRQYQARSITVAAAKK